MNNQCREPVERVLSVPRVSLCPQRNEPQKASRETETRSIVDVLFCPVILSIQRYTNVCNNHVVYQANSSLFLDKQRCTNISTIQLYSGGDTVVEMVTIKDYADSQNVSYEAVRKQIVRYKDELDGHIAVKNRTQYLDDWAVKFLTGRRREHPVILVNQEKDESIETMKQHIESLRAQLMQAQNELLSSKDRIIALQDELKAGIEDKTKYQLLLTDHEEQRKKLEDAEEAIQSERELRRDLQRQNEEQGKQIEELRKEADSYEKSWFGFYRKRGV